MNLEEVRTLIERHATALTPIVDGAVISRVTESSVAESSMSGTVMVLLAQGAKRLAVGKEVHDYSAGQCFIAAVDVPVSGHFIGATEERPALGFAMKLKPALIADLLLEAGAALPRTSGTRSGSAVAVGDATAELVDAVGRMIRLLEHPLDRAVLAPLIERELHWLLLRSGLGAAARDLGLADSGVSRVSHAVAWIREHHAASLRVEELAEIARMSPSAFHRAFRAVTALSPIQYQKQIRLQEARVRLLADPHDIAGAAHGVGYASASQFSRDYRQRFGAPPREDIAHLRTLEGNAS